MSHRSAQPSYHLRPAGESDIPAIASMINQYAAQNIMLPRSEQQVNHALADFLVAESGGALAGCGSLIALTPALAEIRSLAVAHEFHGNGLGGVIVAALVEMAREREYDQVCALTLRPNFFQRQGFDIVDRWSLTPKIWQECVFCPKFHQCDEIAVIINVVEPAVAPGQATRRSDLASTSQAAMRLIPV